MLQIVIDPEDLKKFLGKVLLDWERKVYDMVIPNVVMNDLNYTSITPKFSDALVVYYKKKVSQDIIADLNETIDNALSNATVKILLPTKTE